MELDFAGHFVALAKYLELSEPTGFDVRDWGSKLGVKFEDQDASSVKAGKVLSKLETLILAAPSLETPKETIRVRSLSSFDTRGWLSFVSRWLGLFDENLFL
jgi:hypothetical protein